MILHEEWEYFVGMAGWSIDLCYTCTVCLSQIIYFTQNNSHRSRDARDMGHIRTIRRLGRQGGILPGEFRVHNLCSIFSFSFR